MPRDPLKWADIPPGHDSQLNYAVAKRDSATLQVVEDAVTAGRVKLAYQPIVTAQDPSRPAFHEGLIRVLDETRRVIPARDFIAAVEMTETGRKIDCAALRQGIMALKAHPDLRLSINMSARSIGYPRWTQILDRALRDDGSIAERLILEITESSAVLVPELVISFMEKLQRKGICFALDDFGSGYTSFRFLKDFYFDILKIDGQFIRGIADSADNQIITRAMIALAGEFGMVSIAETVEKPADAAMLQQLGADCMQGYLFGAPTVRPAWETRNAPHENA